MNTPVRAEIPGGLRTRRAQMAKHPDPKSPEGQRRRKDCDAAYARLTAAVDALKALGFKKRDIQRMVSIRFSRRPRRVESATINHQAGIKALAGL
jgi:Holliday junction resolvasome RuvABC DNA-binding subunit